jgi:hypothetical protein
MPVTTKEFVIIKVMMILMAMVMMAAIMIVSRW